MIYQINKNNYKDFEIFSDNKLDYRSYFIPFKSINEAKSTEISKERFCSSFVKNLSGEWDFKFYDDNRKIEDKFDTEKIEFNKIKVPSTWQRNGYLKPVYLNDRYEFHLMPPTLPEKIAVGIYRKIIEIQDIQKQFILSFLGVCQSLDLYINGEYFGYSEGSHNTAEFDISKKLKKGNNEILAVVHKWSTGTYLECQDMFRENGIFRDVLLYELPKTNIFDFSFSTVKQFNDCYAFTLSGKLSGELKDTTIKASISDKNGEIIWSDTKVAETFVNFSKNSLKVSEWSAEIPNVYELTLVLFKNKKEFFAIRKYIGFKDIKINNELFLFNGKKVKFKGVNHHDTSAENGFTVSLKNIENDLKLMKKLNINMIRTSHYPSDPYFMQLATVLGFYIVDEADIETHGCNSIGPKKQFRPNLLSNDKKWQNRYLDRVKSLYERDKNEPCITMWSLGNESGGYKNQDECYRYLKKVSPDIPIHYEGVIRTIRTSYDIISEMYTDINTVKKVGQHKRGKKYKNKPFFLCEYCHAMGVGPGLLDDYWEIFYKYDNLTGGCIWEWKDHAVKHSDKELQKKQYKNKYTYGGDHGEEMHDKNFCVDGLIRPDFSLSSGALNMKEVYRPLRCMLIGSNLLRITNTNSFLNSNEYDILWNLTKDYKIIKNGKINISVAPLSTDTISLDIDTKENADYYLNIICFDKNGNELSHEQFKIKEKNTQHKLVQKNIALFETNKEYCASGIDFKIEFSKLDGSILYTKNDFEYFSKKSFSGFLPNISKAWSDNDLFNPAPKFHRDLLQKMKPKFKNITAENINGKIILTEIFEYKNNSILYYTVSVRYDIFKNGEMLVSSKLTRYPSGDMDLPRFGLYCELNDKLNNVSFIGRGPRENLCDMKEHAPIDLYKSNVSDMNEFYIKPQDNGNHIGTKYLKVYSDNEHGFEFYGVPKFSFSIHNYSQKNLEKATHIEDLIHDRIALSIDGFLRGTGTASCGQDTLSKYRFKFINDIQFSFIIKPF